MPAKIPEPRSAEPQPAEAKPVAPEPKPGPNPGPNIARAIEEQTENDRPCAAVPSDAPVAEPEPTVSTPLAFSNEHWPTIVRQADLAGLTQQLAINAAVQAFQNGQLQLLLPTPSKHLAKPSAITRLAELLSAYAGEAVVVKIDITDEELVTPARLMEEATQRAQSNAEQSIRDDPLLAELLNRVDGVVAQNSVRPVDSAVENSGD